MVGTVSLVEEMFHVISRLFASVLHLCLILGIWKEGEGLPGGRQLSPTPSDLDAHQKAIAELIRIRQGCTPQESTSR
jgi:hypothetical protein